MSKTYSDFSELNKMLESLSDDLWDSAKKVIADESEKMAKAIKADAPVASTQVSHDKHGNAIKQGTYRGGWGKAELREEGKKRIKYGISSAGRGSAKQASLAHLLEFGHEGNKENGFTYVYAKEHIVRNRDKYEQEMIKKIEEIIKNAKAK